MKKIRLLLAILIASIGSVQNALAERVAPVFPAYQPKPLDTSRGYYFYNVGSGNFAYSSGWDVCASRTKRTAVDLVSSSMEGVYCLRFGSYHWYVSGAVDNHIQLSSSQNTDYCLFRIAETEGGYTIQRNYSYDETQFVGYNSGSYIYTNLTSGNIVWQLYDSDNIDVILHYTAQKALYDALEAATDYGPLIAEYEAIYENEASTTNELNNAANSLNHLISINKQATANWTEYPVFIEGDWNASNRISNCIYFRANNCDTTTCKATVEVDEDATLVFQYYLRTRAELEEYGNYSDNSTRYPGNLKVYLDGVEVQEILSYEGQKKLQNYFVELTAGRHTIEWKGISGSSSGGYTNFGLQAIGVQKTPTVTVNLTQAGGLGTEVLYNVDHLKDVRKLVIKGYMNDEDWARVNMMTGLFELDLTDANIETIPQVNPGSYFHKVKLPKTLKSIGTSFSGTTLDEITFPESLTSIGASAFSNTRIKEAIIPDGVTFVGNYAFANNQSLLKVKWPANTKSIYSYCFQNCKNLNDVVIPDGVTAINSYAFENAYRVNTSVPTSVKTIGERAFYQTGMTVVDISDNVSIGLSAFGYCSKLETVNIGKNCTIGQSAFSNCTTLEKATIGEGTSSSSYTFSYCSNLKEIEFPTTFYKIDSDYILNNSTGIGNGGVVTFKSPTMVEGSYYTSFFYGLSRNITIRVPNYLVNTYKLDSYWYNYNIEGFSTSDINYWGIQNALKFYSQDRFEGTPDIEILPAGSWTINGETPQEIGNFITSGRSQQSGGGIGNYSKVISTCNNVTINNHYHHEYYAYNNCKSSTGRWHFLCLPFDFKISEIETSNDARLAVRYYDGANRAANGTGGNWKNYASDDIIPAGTGFIIQASKETELYFHSLDNASKQNVVSSQIFTTSLDANDSEQSSNKGWNLVGNPWVAYYNIHKLNFTGAITVYDGYNKTYKAYSIIDDDYAIQPNQAFFIQCPDEVSEISFPVEGRQITSTITSQNAIKSQTPEEQSRWLVDIELNDGEQSDQTRFVLNNEASITYERSCDASKFFEAGTTCPQLFTIENDEPLAINERPLGDGYVQLGMIVAKSGTFTISATRNQFQEITLIDLETGSQTDLSTDSYTFDAEAGESYTRFLLSLNDSSIATGLQSLDKVESAVDRGAGRVFNLAGQRIVNPQKGVYIMNGKKVVVK